MVRFESKLNSEAVKQLNKFSLKKVMILLLCVSVLCLAIGIIGIAAGEDDSDVSVGVFLIVIGVVITPAVWGVSRLAQRAMEKSASFISDETKEVYIFDYEKVYIEQVGKNFKSSTTAEYSYFYKVQETADYYFLYISKNQTHIVPKKALTDGALPELDDMLRINLGEKYKKAGGASK